MSDQSPGRRASVLRRRRIDVLVAMAIALPFVVGLALAFVGEQDVPMGGLGGPQTSELTAATVVCPEGVAARDSAPVRVTRTPEVVGGELSVRTAAPGTDAQAEAPPVAVAAGDGSVLVPGSVGATTLDGAGAAAPGVIAGRGDRLAVPECRAPAYDEWFVGIGASARYATTLELVNPDDGDAVVDVALQDATGPVEEPALRGIQVPAHGVRRIDLAAQAPRRQATAAHLTVTRGRVTATARNTWDPLGRGRVTTDFLPPVGQPSAEALVLGLPEDPASPRLFLANPGEDEVRTTIRLVTRDSTFTPAEVEDVAVAPRSMRTVNLTRIFSGPAADGVVGLELVSTGPVASSVRVVTKGDLVLLAPAPLLRDPTAAVLPEGAKTMVLGGAMRTGTVHVHAFDAAGKRVAEERVEVGADRASSLALPPKAVRVTVEARNARISGVVTVPARGRQPGLATLRLRAAEARARIPDVGPR